MRRRQLKEIGFVDNFSSLPYWKAEAFAIIGEELKGLQDAETRKKVPVNNKPRGGRRG
jgi:hypothetical protein